MRTHPNVLLHKLIPEHYHCRYLHKDYIMKKSPPIQENQLLELLEENRYNEWVSKNGRKAIVTIVGLIIALVVIFRLGISSTNHIEDDFIQADQLFATWSQAANSGELSQLPTDLEKLNSAMRQHPSLHAKYDGAIAQRLIALTEASQAQPFAERTLRRTKSDKLQLYHTYAEASLLISQGRDREALEKTKALQAVLLSNLEATESTNINNTLTEYNLLRLAILEQKIGDAHEELKAWQAWQQHAAEGKSIAAHRLAIGQVDLEQYVHARQKAIAKGS